MAQETFFDDDDDMFGTDPQSTIDLQELDAFMMDKPPSVKTEQVKPATEEDKEQAKEKGKAKSEEEIANEAKAKIQAEQDDIDNFVLGDGKEKEPKGDESSSSEDNDDSELSGIEELAKDLFKVGILTQDDEEEALPTTQEEFIERFNWEKQKVAEFMVDKFAGRHGEQYRDAFNAIFVNGTDPIQYLSKFAEVQSFKEMDITDEDNQEKIVETFLKQSGWEAEDIRQEVKKLKLNSDLETYATRQHKALVKQEEQSLLKMQEESKLKVEQKKQFDTQYSATIRNILSEKLKLQDFDGVPVNKELADKAVHFLEDKKWKLPSGELITDYDYAIMQLNNPQNHSTKVKLALLLSKAFEEGKPITIDLGPVEKRAVSKESTELFNFARNKKKGVIPASREKREMESFFNDL